MAENTTQSDPTRYDKPYNPREVEDRWYRYWIDRGYFSADENSTNPRRFSIVIPPPNITGSLHLGHALNNTLQDILVRWKRMQGFNTLWVPGTDHAGIATQNVVERQLKAEGKRREQLGREAFIDRVRQWRNESGRTIISQLKRLGASCDWKRERFTMDEGLSAAVRDVFVRLYQDGLIYRGERLINWCPRCETALSDIEVEHEEVKGKMYHIKYPLADDPEIFLTVATTRPETLLGDTAVAVHPEDPRYNKLIGKTVLLPLTSRRIPIVGDPVLVDREFGTGAVKITPGHDFNDEKAGQRHGLPRISLLTGRGEMNPTILEEDAKVEKALLNELAGLKVHQARDKVVHRLEAAGLLIKIEDHRHAIGKCYRCKTVIEPYLSPQWFVKINDRDPQKSLAAPAIEAVRKGDIRFIPDGWKNNYFGWMAQIQDWCISRQIWWGHQIPAWYCRGTDVGQCRPECKEPIVALTAPERCPHCGSADLVQDPDVLDTWFSSALWPFSTLGWPQKTKALALFYPTSTLVTSFDIIFFWVARMIMMGLKFMGEVPFREVYIHALVRDAEGQKMSKSKGNVIDPLEVMEKYGTDALRFTLASMASPGRDIKLSEERIEGNRNFANKIWNAARFLRMNCPNGAKPYLEASLPSIETLSEADRWILKHLNNVVDAVNSQLKDYRFDEASRELYQFLWHEFCDWYIELIKPTLYGTDTAAAERTRTVAIQVFETVLRLLHPFMPFITEELWQTLHEQTEKSIVIAKYPAPSTQPEKPALEGIIDKYSTTEAPPLEKAALRGIIDDIISIATAIRTIRNEHNIPPSQQLRAGLITLTSGHADNIMRNGETDIRRLARLSEFTVGPSIAIPSGALEISTSAGKVFIIVDVDPLKEKARLEKKLAAKKAEFEREDKKWRDPEFQKNAPGQVKTKNDLRRNELSEEVFTLSEQLRKIADLLKDRHS
ncbi:MAG: valine--tRNA ligase [Nitrospirae bacterium]|nr:valine--tRNA ligase [Nitrospirota bacterium]